MKHKKGSKKKFSWSNSQTNVNLKEDCTTIKTKSNQTSPLIYMIYNNNNNKTSNKDVRTNKNT